MLFVIGAAFHEPNHLFRYGHFAPLGLHAEIQMQKADIGIEGISKMYEAKLTNFGFLPQQVRACDFITDASAKGTMVAYAVQQWDTESRNWKTVFEDEKSSFCRPYPLGIGTGAFVHTAPLARTKYLHYR